MSIEEYEVVQEALENAGEWALVLALLPFWARVPCRPCPMPILPLLTRHLPCPLPAADSLPSLAVPPCPIPPAPCTDRFYRLTAVGPSSSPAEARRAADAFRAVALTWMARNQVGGCGCQQDAAVLQGEACQSRLAAVM